MFQQISCRLCNKLQAVKSRMDGSYAVMAGYLTEIKMDHEFGKKKSPELSESSGPTRHENVQLALPQIKCLVVTLL